MNSDRQPRPQTGVNIGSENSQPSRQPWHIPDRTITWLLGAGIVLVALVCRWLWASQPRTVRWDEPDYLIIARNLLRGQGFQVFGQPDLHTPPAGPYLAAAAQAAGVRFDSGLAAWHVLAGAMLCGLLFGLTFEVTRDRRVAAFAGLWAALSPSLATRPLYWGSMTESLFLAFLLAGLWATWRLLERRSLRAGAAAGLFFALSYLVRPEGMLWWMLFLGICLLGTLRRRNDWRALGALALVFVVVAAPYWLYLYRNTGHIMLSGKTGITILIGTQVYEQGSGLGNDIAATLDSTGTEILWLSPERFEISLLDSLRGDAPAVLRRWLNSLRQAPDLVLGSLLGPVVVGLVALGLWARPWSRRRAWTEVFWLASLAPLLIVPILNMQERLLVPLVPIALVWAAHGTAGLVDWGTQTLSSIPRLRPLRPVWTIVVVAGIAVALLLGQYRAAQVGQASLSPSHQAAGLWLQSHTAPGQPIMARDTEIGLYADRPQVAFPNATWPQILAYAQARGARYLVVDDWTITMLRPQLAALLDPRQASSDAAALAAFADDGRTTLIYRFED